MSSMKQGRFIMPEPILSSEQQKLIESVKVYQANIRDGVRRQLLRQSSEELSQIIEQGTGDVSFRVDAIAEPMVAEFAEELSKKRSLVVVAEGIDTKIFPQNAQNPELRILIDPVDGSREIMFNKRSAWSLTGISPDKGDITNLSDIEIAVQTEIPPTKQTIGSVLWAVKGKGAWEEEWDLTSNILIERRRLQSSQAKTIEQGYAIFWIPGRGSQELMGRLADIFFKEVLGPVKQGQFDIYGDNYLTVGGHVDLLTHGVYLFIADLRPVMDRILKREGRKVGLAVHPYDLTTYLIAQEAGVIITDEQRRPLSYPLDTETDCTWIAYANEHIRSQVEPVLMKRLVQLQKGEL